VSKPGYVEPIRLAIELVTTPLLAVIDDDAEPASEGWLGSLCRELDDPSVACVGGRVVNVGLPARRVPRRAGQMTWFGQLGGNVGARSDSRSVDVDAIPEGNCLWRTSMLRQLRIDPIFDDGDATMYGFDLCQQAKALNSRVVFSSAAAILHHLAPRGSDSATHRSDRARQVYSYTRNMTYLTIKHFKWRLPVFVLWSNLVGDSAYLGVLSWLRELTRGRMTRAITSATIRGRLAGLRWAVIGRRNRSGTDG
jgi:hypothetical protein